MLHLVFLRCPVVEWILEQYYWTPLLSFSIQGHVFPLRIRGHQINFQLESLALVGLSRESQTLKSPHLVSQTSFISTAVFKSPVSHEVFRLSSLESVA